MPARRPNILLIVSDEHSPRTMGCMGAAFARTPNMDRLARDGTVFDNAYCNFALCVPSRASLMTGLLCHKIPCYDNGAPFSSALPTWAHMLAREGYRTVLDGKMHFRGPDQLHGFQEHWHESGGGVSGFRWGEEEPSGDAYKSFTTIHVIDEPGEHRLSRCDRARTDAALDFLRAAGSGDRTQPFCLTVGFIYPHYPMVCDRRLFESYLEADVPEPAPEGDLHPRNRHFGHRVWGHDRIAPEETRRSRCAYLAMVTMLDQWIGELLTVLEQSGLADDTLVIYTSDHGDMWGEHGMWGKNMFYEDSARVPLIVTGQRLGVPAARRIATPVSLLDLYPTLRDAAGARDWDVPLDGRSLWPTLTGGAEPADAPVFCDYYSSDTRGPERMLRYGRHKLNYYHDQGLELFDLEADPQELTNLAAAPSHAAVREELLAMLLRDWDPAAIAEQVRIDQNRRACIGESRTAKR